MLTVQTGLDILANDSDIQSKFKGNVGYLCHSASVDSKLTHGIDILKNIFGSRLKKIFGPQHGLITDVQDNMIESPHFTHPYYNLPVYSLYSETRRPTPEMLEGLDHIFIDLQDVGTRIYTYIYTMTYMMEACAGRDIDIIVLDRPNPIGGDQVEGNTLDINFASFVGRHPLPVRHGLTIGEVALMHQKFWAVEKCHLQVISMQGYQSKMSFEDTGLPWVLPSPNLPTVEGCYTFVGTVLFEGTNISEGRGTTRPLEIIGHPKIEPNKMLPHFQNSLNAAKLEGFILRPMYFQPTFQKHHKVTCGGYQIHVTDRQKFRPWRVCQILCRDFVQILGDDFQYKQDAYEYETELNPVDMINGTDKLRKWYHESGSYQFLDEIEANGLKDYLSQKTQISLY